MYLGLGGNLGDPIEQLICARSMLYAMPGAIAGRCSGFYSSSPVGYDEQPDFINCVIELKVDVSPVTLLNQVQAIENRLGRKRVAGNQNAPRLIDIDLLLYGDQDIDSERLTLPHPRMTERLFVLRPLLDLLESDFYASCLEREAFVGQLIQPLTMNLNAGVKRHLSPHAVMTKG